MCHLNMLDAHIFLIVKTVKINNIKNLCAFYILLKNVTCVILID